MPRPAKAEHHCILSVWDITEESSLSRLEVARVLLGRLAPVNAKERNGCTPLHYACGADGYFTKNSERGRLAMARILIDFGANVNANDPGGYTPLMTLTRSSSGNGGSLAQLLMSRGADVEAIDFKGRTPLLQALEYGREDFFWTLIECGASMIAQGYRRRTALHHAVDLDLDVVLQKLLEAGVDIKVRDKQGRLVLEIRLVSRLRHKTPHALSFSDNQSTQ